jgi:glyoxylase-like metal-dependent hydrolase (beta-lactamase superfamily II)
MIRTMTMMVAALALAGCDYREGPAPANEQQAAPTATAAPVVPAAPAAASLKVSRLDCGTATIKNFDAFFSDRPGLYEKAPRDIVDSCYLIQHGDQNLLWDTGFGGALKGGEKDMGDLVARLKRTLTEQLAEGKLTPADIDVVGISHMHADHTGGAKEFPAARLVIGKADFEKGAGKDDPFGPWRKDASKVTAASGDVDIFGDGSVTAIRLPGHTPDHLALLVKLKSGPLFLTGDLYHSTDARTKRGVPPFNTDRAQTLASMDKFEKLARELKAKVVIQHEPADVAKVPAFPATAE